MEKLLLVIKQVIEPFTKDILITTHYLMVLVVVIRKLRHRGKKRHTKGYVENRGKISISHTIQERPKDANNRFLAEQGVPLEAIQDRVGHSRGSRVTEIYLHITKKTKDQIIPILDTLTQ